MRAFVEIFNWINSFREWSLLHLRKSSLLKLRTSRFLLRWIRLSFWRRLLFCELCVGTAEARGISFEVIVAISSPEISWATRQKRENRWRITGCKESKPVGLIFIHILNLQTWNHFRRLFIFTFIINCSLEWTSQTRAEGLNTVLFNILGNWNSYKPWMIFSIPMISTSTRFSGFSWGNHSLAF